MNLIREKYVDKSETINNLIEEYHLVLKIGSKAIGFDIKYQLPKVSDLLSIGNLEVRLAVFHELNLGINN